MSRDEAESCEQAIDELNGSTTPKSLSCPSCPATGFSSLSKLNKHRNGHEKPLECLAEGCYKRFAQRQALDRHTQSRHSSESLLKKYYHCTVDGCKYASTGQRQKRFARADQVKEHIKDYGHYGPHSANDRPRRRPGQKPLPEGYIIEARFEEWSLVGISLQRTVRSCKYSSADTKLWHKDDCGDMFVREASFGAPNGHSCHVIGCYYQLPPPHDFHPTIFKSLKGLQEHRRRAHDWAQTPVPSVVQSQLYHNEDRGSVTSSDTIVSSVSTSNISISSIPESDQPWLRDLDLSITENFESVQCLNPRCDQYMRPGDPRSENNTEDLFLGDRAIGWCYSCFQSEPALQTSNAEFSLPQSGLTSQSESNDLLPISNTYATTSLSTFNPLEDATQIELSTTSANISSLSRENSLRPRLSCTVSQCRKTFRRNYELQRHLMTMHSHTTMSCPTCWRQFRRKDKLMEHVRQAHSISGSESTRRKLDFDDPSIFPGSDWMSSSTYTLNQDDETHSTSAPLGTEHVMDDEITSMDLLSYSPFPEQWNTWQSSTTQPLELQIDTSGSPTLDASRSLTFSTTQEMNVLPDI